MKKSIQLTYPSRSLNLTNVSCLQIGVECPHVFPLEHLTEHKKSFSSEIVVDINEGSSNSGNNNSKTYVLTDREHLEFSELYAPVTVSIKKWRDPYVIVDIAYE